ITRNAEGTLQVVLPEFPNLETPETQTEIIVQGKRDEIGRVNFTVLLAPRLKSIAPRTGMPGSEVRIQTNMPGVQPTVLFGSNAAAFKSKTDKELVVVVPESTEIIPATGLKVPVTIKVNDRASKNSIDFTLLPPPVQPEETFHLSFTAKPNPTT